jgi:hypothetical protein
MKQKLSEFSKVGRFCVFWPTDILAERNLIERHLANGGLDDTMSFQNSCHSPNPLVVKWRRNSYLANRHFVGWHFADRHLADQHLAKKRVNQFIN